MENRGTFEDAPDRDWPSSLENSWHQTVYLCSSTFTSCEDDLVGGGAETWGKQIKKVEEKTSRTGKGGWREGEREREKKGYRVKGCQEGALRNVMKRLPFLICFPCSLTKQSVCLL